MLKISPDIGFTFIKFNKGNGFVPEFIDCELGPERAAIKYSLSDVNFNCSVFKWK